MAIITRVLALVLLSALTSALGKCGWWWCPDFREEAEENIPYGQELPMTAFYAGLASKGPLKVVAAAESEDASQYSCITLTASGPLSYNIDYVKDGTPGTASFAIDVLTGIFKGTLPKGLLGVPNDFQEMTWTITIYRDSSILMKTCNGAFFGHYTSTYMLFDKNLDPSLFDVSAFLPQLNAAFDIEAEPKALC